MDTIVKRNGETAPFQPERIRKAIKGAFWEDYTNRAPKEGLPPKQKSDQLDEKTEQEIDRITEMAIQAIKEKNITTVDKIQDEVEVTIYRAGRSDVAHLYVQYRTEKDKKRKAIEEASKFSVTKSDGTIVPFDIRPIEDAAKSACNELENTSYHALTSETEHVLYDKIPTREITEAMFRTACSMIEREPNYMFVAARLLLQKISEEVFKELGFEYKASELLPTYKGYFREYIKHAVEIEQLRPELAEYDLEKLENAIHPERDLLFNSMGLQTLYDRYFIKNRYQTRIELPQAFWMRVAMGLARLQPNREDAAIRYYNILSTLRGVSSTPTLFNAGTLHEQLSSCYLLTVDDDLIQIFKNYSDNARLSKWAGGIGNDWTPVRSQGAYIKGTNGVSQGGVPWWKLSNDTAHAVNQSFTGDTLTITSEGIKHFRDIKETDLLLNNDGVFGKPNAIHEYVQKEPVILVNTTRQIVPTRVCEAHEYLVIEGPKPRTGYSRFNWEKAPIIWKEAKTLTKEDFILHRIPKKSETKNPLNATTQDSQFYGLLLGDGHSRKTRNEAGISGDKTKKEKNFEFVRDYLTKNKIHYWEYEDGNSLYISWSANASVFSTREMLYNEEGEKRIHPSMLHLPEKQTAFLIEGLICTDGYEREGSSTPTFTNNSLILCEGLRFIAKRLKILASGHKRNHQEATFTKRNKEKVTLPITNPGYSVSVPLTEKVAKWLGRKPCKTIKWIEVRGYLAERVKSVRDTHFTGLVYDIRMEGTPSYSLCNGVVHNGSKRKGAICNYLETWHNDLPDFLELRKNTGDERSRCHDLHTANWIPDLFMQRVQEDGDWWLFTPNTVPDLHNLYGQAFAERYAHYENEAETGPTVFSDEGDLGTGIKTTKENPHHPARKIKAKNLWMKMLNMLFQTGHPWIVFKDPGNIRNPQDHEGVIHSSNLCTEIYLNTSSSKVSEETNEIVECGEVAVCNLGSINLARHIENGKLNVPKLRETARIMVEILDNVVDINFYPIKEAENSNLKHRPIGLGVMGSHTALQLMNIPYGSQEAVEFSDISQEVIALEAMNTSSDLAKERGTYPSFKGSKWDRGLLPLDTVKLIAKERNELATTIDYSCVFPKEWEELREKISRHGMRNSNVLAIAPTATIANISGVSEGITPETGMLYVKDTLSGTFPICNPILVKRLQELNLWDEKVLQSIKYHEGSVQAAEIPDEIKKVFQNAYEIPQNWLIECASRRQKWVDQGQSCNLFVTEPKGKELSDIFFLAWEKGLKSTYYLRSRSASGREKATLEVQNRQTTPTLPTTERSKPQYSEEEIKACSLEAMRNDGTCEACE